MSLLWKDKFYEKLLKISNRPSPKHNKHILCFAQSKLPLYFRIRHFIEGISLFISRGCYAEGSMTVEATIVLPLFLFFFLNLGSAIEMIRLHGNLELALWEVGNRLAVYGHAVTEDGQWDNVAGVVLSSTYVRGQIVDYLSEEYLDSTPLRYGADGLLFLESAIDTSEDTFDIVITYSVGPMSAGSSFVSFRMANRYYGHLWNGYEIPVVAEGQEQYVYVAENGEVYHTNGECTHLKLSVEQVGLQEALISANENNERYEACEKCCDGISIGMVYITKEGDCYHYQRECPGLKRTVYYVPISQVSRLRLCSRCAA